MQTLHKGLLRLRPVIIIHSRSKLPHLKMLEGQQLPLPQTVLKASATGEVTSCFLGAQQQAAVKIVREPV
jgi:hypothetical protein